MDIGVVRNIVYNFTAHGLVKNSMDVSVNVVMKCKRTMKVKQYGKMTNDI